MIKTRISQKLRYWRLKKGVGQVALAKKAGLTQATLSRIENNLEKPHWNTVQRLAQALEIDFQTFIFEQAAEQETLDRHELDAVARAILSGERNLKPKLKRLADIVASLMSRFLEAQQAPGRKQVQTLRWNAPFRKGRVLAQTDEKLIRQIIERVRKLASAYA